MSAKDEKLVVLVTHTSGPPGTFPMLMLPEVEKAAPALVASTHLIAPLAERELRLCILLICTLTPIALKPAVEVRY